VKQGVIRSQAKHRKITKEVSSIDILHHQSNLSIPQGASRTEEIRQWAAKYEQMHKKERQRRCKELDNIFINPISVEYESTDDIQEEEEDFLDENYEY
ncbi:hypothetical protein SK128_002552, partial [Halocaridina rubra]